MIALENVTARRRPAGIVATERYFDGLAADWDTRMVLDEAGSTRLEEALDRLRIEPGHTVIDAGCGTGILRPFLSRRIGSRGRVVGIDVAGAMIAKARGKCAGDGRFEWLQGDVSQLLDNGLGGQSPGLQADRIVCFSAFAHFDRKPRVLSAFYRALRSGGRFAIIHLKASSQLNRFHASLASSPVRSHRLPPACRLARVARRQGFRLLWWQEQPGLYLVIGEKPA